MDKLWANSGDSHFTEPPDLYKDLPESLRDRLPRSEKSEDGTYEIIHVDGQSFRRDMPKPRDPNAPRPNNLAAPADIDMDVFQRQVGAGLTAEGRLKDNDDEGVWAEVIYPSLGIWQSNIRTPEIAKLGARAINEWAIDFQRQSPRFVCTANIPFINVDDAVEEVKWAADQGFMAGFCTATPPLNRPGWAHEEWDPMWDAFAETGMVISFHIGTEAKDPTERIGIYHRGRGGAVLNYVETTYGGQRCVTQLIAAGVLDRHPNLKVLVSEGGATWGPFCADRMDEGYRQHGMAVRPQLSKLPSEYLYEQVYASFQHDRSAVKANSAMGWKNVMWGSDYPHFEGTFGHTQKTLHELFDDTDAETSHRIRIGAFAELFPAVPLPPTD